MDNDSIEFQYHHESYLHYLLRWSLEMMTKLNFHAVHSSIKILPQFSYMEKYFWYFPLYCNTIFRRIWGKKNHFTCFGVSSSLILRPSNKKRRLDTGTPTRSEYDFFNFPICVVILTRKWISLESCPTTFNLMYSVSPLASA